MMMSTWGCEGGLMGGTDTFGQRLVFTADEENIKAILATQFREFGKGPRFREEWEEFLGHSALSEAWWWRRTI